jgi:hypothetical protein
LVKTTIIGVITRGGAGTASIRGEVKSGRGVIQTGTTTRATIRATTWVSVAIAAIVIIVETADAVITATTTGSN